MSSRKIAASLSIGASTVIDCLHRARRARLTWPLEDGLDDVALERRLYPPPATTKEQRPLPNWAVIQRELKRPGVTLPTIAAARPRAGTASTWVAELWAFLGLSRVQIRKVRLPTRIDQFQIGHQIPPLGPLLDDKYASAPTGQPSVELPMWGAVPGQQTSTRYVITQAPSSLKSNFAEGPPLASRVARG